MSNQATDQQEQKPQHHEISVECEGGKVHRKFTQEWATSGSVDIDKIPAYVKSLVIQRKSMLTYIEALHNKLDELLGEQKPQDRRYSLEEFRAMHYSWRNFTNDLNFFDWLEERIPKGYFTKGSLELIMKQEREQEAPIKLNESLKEVDGTCVHCGSENNITKDDADICYTCLERLREQEAAGKTDSLLKTKEGGV